MFLFFTMTKFLYITTNAELEAMGQTGIDEIKHKYSKNVVTSKICLIL